ncbi:MAG: glycosyltransferase family 4 protein [Anaerolineales bacterium]|nr:glycosyltransferase family 4 protein [Anaerolineales bacterium]
MSNALLEAMSMGLPVIATAVSGTVDIVSDRIDGLLIRPDSAEELAQAMTTIIQDSDLAQKLGQQARQKMVAEFSMESVARQYSELYQQLRSR